MHNGRGALPVSEGERNYKNMKVYAQLMDAKDHPDYSRRAVRPPNWDTVGNKTRFIALRNFKIKDNRIIDMDETLKKYTETNQLCDIIWPFSSILFTENIKELTEKIKEKGLWLFDIWGYVPGSGKEGTWRQYKPDPKVLEEFERILGDQWSGMDVGEQDGRYVLSYVSQMVYPSAGGQEQYLNFQKHMEKICDSCGNKMTSLVAITLGHHELKEGVYTCIGAETAQMHPNAQVFYSFLRGAGKQNGVPWFGNASVYNRWGYKTYGTWDIEEKVQGNSGPKIGTSLSLLKRLIYSHILYNCLYVGFEGGWFERENVDIEGSKLSPIGIMQKYAREWVEKNGQPGTMLTQTALIIDFFSGWTFPNYNYQIYRTWGNRPYTQGDYFTNNILDMFYPGYQNASYFHDETGFNQETPWGDSIDCLMNDAESWLLERYPILVVSEILSSKSESYYKLDSYVKNGGHLVITAQTLKGFGKAFGGIDVKESKKFYGKGTVVEIKGDLLTEKSEFELYDLFLPEHYEVLASCKSRAAIVRTDHGKGKITVIASPFGSVHGPEVCAVHCEEDKPLPNPYPLLGHVRLVLEELFKEQKIFDVGEGLSVIVCRKEGGKYTVGICNNTLEQKKFNIQSNIGQITQIHELELDCSEKNCVGYLPLNFEQADIGMNDESHIAGGDIRIFEVAVNENTDIMEHNIPEKRKKGRAKVFGRVTSIKEEILKLPTFFQHFDTAVLDWKVLHQCETSFLKKEGMWIKKQGLHVIIDVSSGINLYPDLRLVNNDEEEYNSSLACILDVMEKMGHMGAKDLLISLHRAPENNFSYEETENSFRNTMNFLCKEGQKSGITIHLRQKIGDSAAVDLDPDIGVGITNKSHFYDRSMEELLDFAEKIDADNLKVALNTAMVMMEHPHTDKLKAKLQNRLGMWLIGGAEKDITGRIWSINSPLALGENEEGQLKEVLEQIPAKFEILDILHSNWDEVYEDLKLLE